MAASGRVDTAAAAAAAARKEALSGFQDILQKCEASLMPAIEEHVTNEAFDSAKDGLDYLEVKNSLLLSYLIDLTYHVREKVAKKHNEDNFRRLMETRTVLDKTRPLEKKMRYQLDKLLAAATTTTSFAAHAAGAGSSSYSGGVASGTASALEQDPLTFRPDPSALVGDGAHDESDSDDDDSDSDSDDGEEDQDSDMDDLEAARATLEMARARRRHGEEPQNDGNGESGGGDTVAASDAVYRAPRLASMPYALDEDNDDRERQKRRNQRLRQSELAQTLRAEFGEAPEVADAHGGGSAGTAHDGGGRQREAARRMAQREKEKIQMEEDNFIRLTTSRKEKKERNRLMREESSNLAAIANLGNVVRGVSSAFENDSQNESDDGNGGLGAASLEAGRHSNGKRRRSAVDEATGHSRKRSGRGVRFPKNNELQQALYGKTDKSKRKKRY